MNIDVFLKKLEADPSQIQFADTMAVIDQNYHFTETTFINGTLENQAGENSGSCKLFSFAMINTLDEAQTLACFGTYYRDDVLGNADGEDHQNIRNFMATGWSGISFSADALIAK